MSSIEKIDKNFALPKLEGAWEWHDAVNWPLHARGWNEGIAPWRRLPEAVKTDVTSNVWELSSHTAGFYFEFSTDSPDVAVQWRLRHEALAMPHMPATGVSSLDAYRWTASGWRMAGAARPEGQQNRTFLCRRAKAGVERLRVYLPLYNGLTELLFGLCPSSKLELHTSQKPAVCVYGTSIVQGGCASRPGMGYTAILGRLLDCPVINLGFSGSGRAEPAMADVLSQLRPSAFLIDCLPNLAPDFAEAHLREFVPRLLHGTGDIPVLFVSRPNLIVREWGADRVGYLSEVNRIQSQILAQYRKDFPKKLFEISGESLLGQDGDDTVDGVHPTDLGFHRIAHALAPTLREILS